MNVRYLLIKLKNKNMKVLYLSCHFCLKLMIVDEQNLRILQRGWIEGLNVIKYEDFIKRFLIN